MKRRGGGRGLISVKDCVDKDMKSLWTYVQESEEKVIIAVRKDEILVEGRKTKTVQCERQEKCRSKNLHGKYFKETDKGTF